MGGDRRFWVMDGWGLVTMKESGWRWSERRICKGFDAPGQMKIRPWRKKFAGGLTALGRARKWKIRRFSGNGKKRGLTRKNGCLEGIQHPFFIWCYRRKLDIAVKQYCNHCDIWRRSWRYTHRKCIRMLRFSHFGNLPSKHPQSHKNVYLLKKMWNWCICLRHRGFRA